MDTGPPTTPLPAVAHGWNYSSSLTPLDGGNKELTTPKIWHKQKEPKPGRQGKKPREGKGSKPSTTKSTRPKPPHMAPRRPKLCRKHRKEPRTINNVLPGIARAESNSTKKIKRIQRGQLKANIFTNSSTPTSQTHMTTPTPTTPAMPHT